jgi:hypothetical protein
MSNGILMAFIITRNIAVIAAIVGAVYLASIDMNGWGWLIFAAIVISDTSVKIKKVNEEE